MKMIIMIMNMIIKEIKKMIEKIYMMIIIIIIIEMNEMIRNQNYYIILINIMKNIINKNIILRIIYY